MKKIIVTIISLILAISSHAQIGINTKTSQATFDIISENSIPTGLFFCRSKSMGTKGLPMAQLCSGVVCRDYMLLPFLLQLTNIKSIIRKSKLQ